MLKDITLGQYFPGNSKWNNIKNKKGKEDAKKGKIFNIIPFRMS